MAPFFSPEMNASVPSDSYLTLAQSSEGLYREKGSRFIAYAKPTGSEEAIRDYLEQLRKAHFSARHICYAWRLGPDKLRWRANDDGEPSGTAGRPILGQIDSYGLSDVLVAVVRYFGGILLGTGGLTVAYREAASNALAQAETTIRVITDAFRILYPYELTPEIQQLIKEFQPEIINPEYLANCKATFLLPKSRSDAFIQRIGQWPEIGWEKA